MLVSSLLGDWRREARIVPGSGALAGEIVDDVDGAHGSAVRSTVMIVPWVAAPRQVRTLTAPYPTKRFSAFESSSPSSAHKTVAERPPF